MRYPLMTALSAYLVALFVSAYGKPAYVLLLAAAAAIVPLFGRPAERFRRPAVTAALFLAVGLVHVTLVGRVIYSPIADLAGLEIQVVGTVAEAPEVFESGAERTAVKIRGIDGKRVTGSPKMYMTLYSPIGADVGDEISFTARAREPSAAKNGFDTAAYYRSKGIFLNSIADPDSVSVTPPAARTVNNRFTELRRWTAETLRTLAGDDSGALMSAVLLGHSDAIPRNLEAAYRDAGLTHIFSASGMHLSVLLAILTWVLGVFGIKGRSASLIMISAVVGFMALAGFSPSITRAGIMQIIYLAGAFAGRKGHGPTSLVTAAAVICMANPYAVCDVGLQLSFTSSLGILIFSQKLTDILIGRDNRRAGRLASALAGSLSTSVAATVMTAPVLLLTVGTVSLVGPLVNLVALWPVSAVFALSAMTALLSAVPGLTPLAVITAALGNLLLGFVSDVAAVAASIPFSSVSLSDHGMILLILGIGILILAHHIRRRTSDVKFRWTGLATGILVAVFAISHWIYAASTDDILTVAFADVGQGDCTIIKRGSRAIIIDCGSQSSMGADVGRILLKDLGVTEVEAIFVTHFHRDHADGVDELIYEYPGTRIYHYADLADSIYSDSVYEAAALTDSTVETVLRTRELELLDGISLTMITDHSRTLADENDRSLIALVRYGESSVLVTGDLTEAGEEILYDLGIIPDVDILKVGHHGSNTSSSLAFLNTVSPDYAVISVGENTYGHPGKEALTRLSLHTGEIYTTLQNGSIIFKTTGDGSYTVAVK